MTNGGVDSMRRLRELEGIVRRGKRVFQEVGDALVEIRNNRPYWEPHATFEEYCQKRLGFRERTGTQARRLFRPSPSTDAATAYHEAGHAVAGLCLGLRVRHVTIVPDEDSAGHVKSEREKPSTAFAVECGYLWHPSRFRAEKLVMRMLAGEVAQRRYNPRSVRWRHGQSDRNQSLDILLKYNPYEDAPGLTHHYEMLRKWTVSLIEQHWHLVEAVAKALLEHRQLSGTQVRAVINAAQNLA